ncbi:non-ribosomal peptide synthetase [Aquimarina longa]|uniref:non-ribosomal peptide synthetase n=1 Tax=Aquimarina longa TaxID=1080221 RepID=UPI001967F425|nr:non-ribosomal peptide synthetase [Aquimarina longa]
MDKKALPAPDSSELSTREYVAPRNETEEKLVAIWQELLGVERVGIEDNFFELGGHSLLATRLVSMIRKELCTEISIREVFSHTTISRLGEHLLTQSKGVLLPNIEVMDRSDRIPLSFSQERLWFLDQLQGSTEYHIPIVLRLEGSLDISILEQTLQEIVSRHEVLRSLLVSEEGIGYQEIIGAEDWSLDRIEITDETALESNLEDYLTHPFDLSKEYKLRSCLYALGGDQYVLACVFHHIASDGWSEGILVDEFMELYSALQSGRSADLPELHLQYSDYAIWQRKYLEGAVLEDQLSYWEDKLKGVSTLSLPTDYVRPSVQSNAGGNISFELDEELSSSLESLCQKEGVTLFMLLLAVFKVLLSRYSGEEDICVGTPIANRTQSELEGMIGFFVNTLALRSDLSGDPSFQDVLRSVKQTTLEGYDHQLVPFEKVVDRVVTTRDMSMSPLFQVLFVVQNTPDSLGELGIEDIRISNYDFEVVASKFDLTFNVLEGDQGISLGINYSTALFDEGTIDRMLLHYESLLKSICRDITQSISSLSMLSRAEKDELLTVFNDTNVSYPKDKTIVDLFEEQVRRTPDAIAVVYDGEELSYQELDKRSNQLGHYLQAEGVQPDDLIGICLDRSLEMLVGILGILKSGGAYVPIDPDYPEGRIDYMVSDSGVNMVLSSSSRAKVLNTVEGLSVILLDTDWTVIKDFSEESLSDVVSPSNLAYVIYTSGSTGAPKGVLISHENVVRLFKHDSCLYDFNSNDVWSLFHSFCFDFSVWEIYGSLLHGSRLVVVPTAVTKDAISFRELLVKEGVTVLNQTPSSFYGLQEEFLSGNLKHSLRYVIFGGESLNPYNLGSWKNSYPDCKLVNMYGITETTVHVTYKELLESDVNSLVSNIGSAIPTLCCYIVDAHLNLVPIGVEGELCVGGPGLSVGYLNREDLTREKFIKNPFSDVATSRLYRSGDLARWLPDGSIEYIGRKDDQVKIRGYRIELGEIEHVLSSLSGVIHCCVLAKEDGIGTNRLVGYVVLEGALDKEGLQDQLKVSLPEYMVPQLWIQLEEMPLTGNGKLDKKALPAPDSSELSTREYVAPGNETEEKLVTIWQELLGVEKIGIQDDFFELGGDSIISIRLISKINETFNQHIQLQDLFKYSNIQSFSASVLNNDTDNHKIKQLYETVESEISSLRLSVLESIEDPDLIEDVYPMTDVQQGMTMESLLDPSLAVFHDQMIFPIKDKSFDIITFRKSIALLIEKHSIFRTSFNFSDYYQPVQIVSKTISFDIGYKDLSLFDQQTQEKKIEEFLVSEREASFVTKQVPLYRFDIFTIDTYNKLFIYQFHHSIMDGWSVASFVTELYKTYYELKKRDDYYPSIIACSQKDFIIRELVTKQDVAAITFWKEELSGYKYLDIFSEATEISEYYTKQYDLAFLTDLQKQCKEYNITLKTIFFGAYIYALQMFTHEEELTVGLVSNNRPQIKDGDNVLGCFLNTLPVRYTFQSEESWVLYFKSVEKKMRDIHLNGHLTFFEIKRLIGINKDDSFFDALFNYIDFHVYNDIIPENSSTDDSLSNNDDDFEKDLNTSSFERTSSSLNLTVDLTGDAGFKFVYELHKNFKSEISLEHFHSYIDNILHCFNDELNTPVSRESILSEKESKQLLHDFNDTTVAYPQDETVVNLFENQVNKTPNSIAIVFEEKQLTYKELDEKSNQLASYLQKQGVTSESLVGICIDRSEWMIVGILGIMKAGGAYIPIDPSYPKERIDYMIVDSGIKVLLTDLNVVEFIEDKNDVKTVLLDKDWEIITKEKSKRLSVLVSPNNLAYVIYTSGSTGNPKGVMIEHNSLTDYIITFINYFQITESDSILSQSTISFDTSIEEIFPILSVGGKLVISKSNKDFNTILSLCEKHKITVLSTNPFVIEFLNSNSGVNLFSLEKIISGGDVLKSLYINNIYDKISIYNTYGPTEATVCVTYFRINEFSSTIPIGKPIANTSLYILDDNEDLLPIGVIGELCIGGSGVARGYLNQEALTREKFISNPFKEGDKIYKTGDLARWLPDGNLEFMGRKDDQVKIRGYRIELGEIEHALSSLSEVIHCCVLAKEDVIGTNRLVGYVVLKEALDKENIQQQLKLRLPEYMIPTVWVTLDRMPLTSNGKLDKKALPTPDSSELSTREYVAPRNETEEQLVDIWQDLLGIDKVGVHDNFFELGGHSLLATRLVSMIRKELCIEISIREIFEYTTISALGEHLSIQSEGVLLPSIEVADRSDRIPLSFSQERLWFLDQLHGSTEYHIPIVLRLKGSLDISILEQTLQEIVSRHEVLRSLLLSEEGIGYQKIIEAEGWSLDREEVSDEIVLKKNLEDYLMHPFDLSKDYKLRACLYTLEHDQYILACVFHHIASDGWSEGILVNEFVELYSAMTQGRTPNLPLLSIQYTDYAIWQRKYISGEILETQLSYWENQLRGVTPLLLPTDYIRPSTQSTLGAIMSFHLNQKQKDSLDLICKSEGVTMFMLLLSVFKVLLYKYSGQEDICVGTPIANRTQSELEGVIGFFINNLTIRTKINYESTFRDLLVQVKETTLTAYSNQNAPFEKVVDRVMTTRDASMSPLFQAKFLLDNAPKSTEVSLEKLTIDTYERAHISSILDISFNAIETEQEIFFNIEYCTDLFKRSTIESMSIHFKEIIDNVIKNVNEPISTLEVLPIKEKQQILLEFNETQFAYPKNKTLIDLFEEQVNRTPDTIAIVFEDEALTYKELNEQSNCLAYYLKNTGQLESEDIVGVMMNRSIWSIVSMLGIFKSGTCYLPIDKDYPDARKSFIINDADVKLLIIDSESLFEVMDYDTKIFSIDIEFETISKEVPTLLDLDSNVKPSDLAYIIYTSGSTGNPKGVMIEHGSIVNTILSQIDVFSVTKADSCLQYASHSFDASISEIFISLLSGSKLYIIEEENKLDVNCFVDYVEKHQITIATLPPAFFTLLDCNQIQSIKTLITAGEKSPIEQAKLFSKIGKYINAYGPTEASICSTTFSCDIDTIVPIGRPIANTQTYILNDSQKVVPIGVIGELCISGAGLARGYLNRENLTREKFIPNPFIEGERLYKTGDLARWLPNGNIQYVGRKDDQVKIRGYRIELGEIESVLTQLPEVKQAVVLANEDISDSKRLIGYIVTEDNFDKESIQNSLKTQLPDYMVPQLWVVLDHIPLTSNGKVNKKALPSLELSDLSSKEYVEPRNEKESQLVEIWKNLLGVDKVGIYDNFFEMGGHSLLATQLVSMIRKKLLIEIEIADIFTYTTIFALGEYLSVQSEGVLLPTIVVEDRPVRIPLSFSQERLWFLDQLGGSIEYHIPTVFCLKGALDILILEQSLKEIVCRHEILRTVIRSDNGIGYQEIIPSMSWRLDRVIINSESKLEDIINNYLMKPFDLSKDYMLRSCLYDLGNDQYVLTSVFHHIASDGWSGGILMHEFMELYRALQSGRPAVLPELHLQYADYAIWQRKYLEGAVLEEQLSYWEEKLRGVSTLSLPTDYVRPAVQSNAGASISVKLNKEVSNSLTSLCKEEGVTLFMFLLSAFKVLLSRYSGQDDICVGTSIANRTQSELEGMIGFFVNTLALRSDLSGNPSFRDVLATVKQTTLEGYDHQLAPFEKVVDRLVTTRDMSMTPLFQVLFDFQKEEASDRKEESVLAGVTLSDYEFDTDTAQFDLIFSTSEGQNGISLEMNYCTALFTKRTIDGMLLHYQELLLSIVSDMNQPIGGLSMLTSEETHQLLHEFNETTVIYPRDKTIVDLLEEQVKKTPNNIAIVFEGEELTYKELSEKSNQLALYLQQNYDLTSNDIVGIMLDRSIWAIISILGILKTGACYLPIDKEYPDIRKSFVINDANIKLLIIESESLFDVIDYTIPIFSIDIEFETISKEGSTLLTINNDGIKSSDLAYIIYTSGSTGHPKGVMIEHYNLVNYLLYSIEHYGGKDSYYSFPLFSSLSFDLTQTSIYLTLLTGGQLHIYRDNNVSSVLQDIVLNDAINSIKLTPTHLSFFSDLDNFKLKRFIIGGEQLTHSDLSNLGQLDPLVKLFNEYGPTEATIGCTVLDVTNYQSLDRIHIGRPMGNTSIYIVNETLELLPIGAVGELCIGGDGLARGYLNRKELTKEKFISNPFVEGERLYKTGDLARWLPSGDIEFVGRKDDQVKIRGYRIELGEVENVLTQLPDVKQATVLVNSDIKGNNRLVGYVVFENDFDKELIQDLLKAKLPDYMIPQLWVVLDDFPLTNNGKIDKKALPDPELSDLSSKEYVAPTTDIEITLVKIWQALLGLEQVGIQDDFFELGGHSLLATQLVSMIRKELSIEISIQEIFEHTTVVELASLIEFFEQDINEEEDKENYNVTIEI